MKKLLIKLALAFAIVAPTHYLLGEESVIEHQFREEAQQTMLAMIAKSNVTIKILVNEVRTNQAALEHIEKLAANDDIVGIKKYIASINEEQAEEQESDTDEGQE